MIINLRTISIISRECGFVRGILPNSRARWVFPLMCDLSGWLSVVIEFVRQEGYFMGISPKRVIKAAETIPLCDHPFAEVPGALPDADCLLVHRRLGEASATVNGHDCLFQSVAFHSLHGPNRQFAYREPCRLRMGMTQPCSALPRSFGLRPPDRRITRRFRP